MAGEGRLRYWLGRGGSTGRYCAAARQMEPTPTNFLRNGECQLFRLAVPNVEIAATLGRERMFALDPTQEHLVRW